MIMNVIVLIFEILYYSMFMKFARKEGKFWRYLLLFSLITIAFCFINVSNLFSYLILVLMMLYGLKYIVKIKVILYDMLLIVTMLLLKLIIEFVVIIIFYNLLDFNQLLTTIIFDLVKILFLFIFKNKIYKIAVKLKELWNKNNFYVRYFFIIGVYVYVIISIISVFWLIVI